MLQNPTMCVMWGGFSHFFTARSLQSKITRSGGVRSPDPLPKWVGEPDYLRPHPGPAMVAIHWAVLSCLISLSRLAARSLLPAAALASGEMTPIREMRHLAWDRTTQTLTSLLNWPVRTERWPSSSIWPVLLIRCCTCLSTQGLFLGLKAINDPVGP